MYLGWYSIQSSVFSKIQIRFHLSILGNIIEPIENLAYLFLYNTKGHLVVVAAVKIDNKFPCWFAFLILTL
jgi:hypothetical protein